ncbi:penicillin-binding protein 2, partial [bacterium]|nr:penicillin-binding protein 2 [bacterium]
MRARKAVIIDADRMDRLQIFMLFMLILLLMITMRLFYLQVLNKHIYSSKAEAQHSFVSKIKPKRGEIFLSSEDNIKYPLAINKNYLKLYAVPNLIDNPFEVSEKLAEVLEMDQEIIFNRISKEDDIYEPIKSKLTDDEIEKVNDLDIDGLDFIKETYRYYPNENIGSHLVGFVGYQKDELVGNYGLEGWWEEELKGQELSINAEKDVYGNFITIGERSSGKVENGKDLYLTIDRSIQHFSCRALEESVKEYEALKGSVIVLNPKNGDILAMCNYPDFNPNTYYEVESVGVYNNDATFVSYEPGSVFKAITMAMGLDLDLVSPETTYFDTGGFEVEDYVIKNSDNKAYGNQTMVQVLDESLNTGAAFVAEKVGRKRFLEYAQNFGFGTKTSIELNSESSGDLSNLDRLGKVFLATASYGQGITTTPIQLVMAFGSLVNGGYLYKPRIIKEIVYSDGKREEIESELVQKVISDRTAKQISAMLISVIESGHASLAKVDGYYLGGKTGTA